MSFYTDEQLSMILSANEGCVYWDRISVESYALDDMMRCGMAEDELFSLDDWLCALGVDCDGATAVLRRLEKKGLA